MGLGPPIPHLVLPPPGIKNLNDSLWELYSPNAIPKVDVIFFHGLQTGDLEDSAWRTWLGRDDEQVVWPQVWLSEKFPLARILCVSYNSSAIACDDPHDVYAPGENLVSDIILDTRYNIGQNCPVILVGHCLGGLVIKELIHSATRKLSLLNSGNYDEDIERLNVFLGDTKGGVMKEIVLSAIERKRSSKSRNRDRYQGEVNRIRNFLGNCKGAFFYATPHLDSRIADLARLLPHTSPGVQLLKMVHTQSARINEEFRRHRLSWNIQTFGMAEGRKTNYMGFNATVVEEASARYDMDDFDTERTADHFTVCRASNCDDPVLSNLSRFIGTVTYLRLEGTTDSPPIS